VRFKKANRSDANGLITPAELAEILQLSEKEIITLVRGGVLKRTTGTGPNRIRVMYDWRENVQRYIIHVRKPREESRDQYAEEKRLTQAIVRQQKELEFAIARGDMVRRSRVVQVVTAMLGTIKNHVLAIPSRCTRQLIGQRDVAKVRTILNVACRASLRESEDFGSHSFDETSKNGTHAQAQNDALVRYATRIKRRRRKS